MSVMELTRGCSDVVLSFVPMAITSVSICGGIVYLRKIRTMSSNRPLRYAAMRQKIGMASANITPLESASTSTRSSGRSSGNDQVSFQLAGNAESRIPSPRNGLGVGVVAGVVVGVEGSDLGGRGALTRLITGPLIVVAKVLAPDMTTDVDAELSWGSAPGVAAVWRAGPGGGGALNSPSVVTATFCVVWLPVEWLDAEVRPGLLDPTLSGPTSQLPPR